VIVDDGRKLGLELIEKWLPGSDWVMTFDRARQRAAATFFDSGEIRVSLDFTAHANPAEFEQVMLHEIAHVLTGPGVLDSHGVEWKNNARRIGYRGKETVRDWRADKAEGWKVVVFMLTVTYWLWNYVSPTLGTLAGLATVIVTISLIWRWIGPTPKRYRRQL
jgi:hypothetical protein